MSRPDDQYRCSCATPKLIARVGSRATPVHAAFAGDLLSRIYCARCTRCHGRYVGPWQPDAYDGGRP